jgi:hypothetical protein
MTVVSDNEPPEAPGCKARPSASDSLATASAAGLYPLDKRIPLSTFDGWLKFHNPKLLTPAMKAIIDFCCPGFLSQEASEETILIRAKRLADSGVSHIVPVPADQARNRRWSGDSNMAILSNARLSRGSYFGVCQDASGDDRGDVALELAAYRNPKLSGKVEIFDLNWSTNAETLSLPKSHTFAFIFDIGRFRARCDPELFKQCSFKQYSFNVDAGQTIFEIPYLVEHKIINNVLDLRRKNVQAWLCKTFRHGDGVYWHKPSAGDIKTFFAMIPSLLDMTLGGSDETQSIGFWLRSQGVSALIYPSARCIVAITYHGDEPDLWFGWNLVDYRSSPLPPIDKGMELDFAPWSKHVPPGCGIQVGIEGSWALTGIQEAQERAYSKKLAIVEKDFAIKRGWYFERGGTGEFEALCSNYYCDWSYRGSSLADLPEACPQCGARLDPTSEKPTYKEFGAFLNAVVEVAIGDWGMDSTLVRSRIDFWLDRQHLAEYSGRCFSGDGCTEADVIEVVRLIKRSLDRNTPFPH